MTTAKNTVSALVYDQPWTEMKDRLVFFACDRGATSTRPDSVRPACALAVMEATLDRMLLIDMVHLMATGSVGNCQDHFPAFRVLRRLTDRGCLER